MTRPVTIALIDGPLAPDHPALGRAEAFCTPHPDAALSPAARHAGAMAAAILRGAADAVLLSHVIFPGALTTSAAAVSAALDRAARSEADIVHCSFGIGRDLPQLARAVAAVLAAGKRLVAAAPARGQAVYPALYSGVIAVQGDARCAPRDWSLLDLPHAAFGACPSGPDPAIRGASIAAAHFTGLLARHLPVGGEAAMRDRAAYHGRERILEGRGVSHAQL